MAFDRRDQHTASDRTARDSTPAPGKQTLTECLPVQRSALATPQAAEPDPRPAAASVHGPSTRGPTLQTLFGVQRAAMAAAADPAQVHAAAARGTATAATRLPYADQIQRAFGRHDISGIQAHVGPEAASSAREMGARGYATGDHVVLGAGADLHTVVHEAAHVVQQRGGVQLQAGVGTAGDRYEQHADAVADRVVRGESAESLLDQMSGGARSAQPALQCKLEWTDTRLEMTEIPGKDGGPPSRVSSGGTFEEYRNILDALRRYQSVVDQHMPKVELRCLHDIAHWSRLQLRDHPAEVRNQVIQRLVADVDREILALNMDPKLSRRESSFFQQGPDLATAESRLTTWMADGLLPMKHEDALIYDGGVLRGASRGEAARPGENATAPVTDEHLDAANPRSRDQIVVTHNHPGAAPLSRGDVVLAITKEIKEVRAVGAHGVFSIARTGRTWGVSAEDAAQAFMDSAAEWRRQCPARLRDLRPTATATQTGATFAEDVFLPKHFACKLLAARSGGAVVYQHPDEQQLIQTRARTAYEKRDADGADKRKGFASDTTPGTSSKGFKEV